MSDKPASLGMVELAAISGAHGITGEVRLKLFGEGIAAFKKHISFNDGALTLAKLRDDKKGGAIARFTESTDRNMAEKLRGTVLAIPRTSLPELEEGEYYHSDILGLAAVSDTGEALGIVIAIEDYGAGDVIEIERPAAEGKKPQLFMVPMTKQAVPEWNSERLIVTEDFVTA